MPVIYFKVELNLNEQSTALVVAGNGNAINNNDNDNIVFTIKGTKLYVSIVTLSARDNQKL